MNNNFKRYRKGIDRIDRRIIALLGKRYGKVLMIGRIKRKEDKSVVDKKREQAIVNRIENLIRDKEKREYVKSVFRAIFKASYRSQRNG